MSMHPLPPQAYTKDTLVKAYSWLQSQNDSIKEMASNPDILVSLYLKARLNGESALERPSIQNFKNELKNLAGMMGEFEVEPTPTPAPATASSVNQNTSTPRAQAELHSGQSEPQKILIGTPSLDAKSSDMIREVKDEFNLSSEQEALRLLISVGYKKIKDLI